MGGRGRGGPGPGIMPILQQLDLTDQQREQLRALMEANRPADPGQMRDAQLKLHAAILADTPDPQSIEAAKAAVTAAQGAELDRQVEMLAKVAQILTPDQRQQWLKLSPRARPDAVVVFRSANRN